MKDIFSYQGTQRIMGETKLSSKYKTVVQETSPPLIECFQ